MFVAIGLAAAWVVPADPASGLSNLRLYLAFLVSPWVLLSFAGAAVFVVFGIWYLRFSASPLDPATAFDAKLRQDGRLLALVLVAFVLSLSGVGYLFINETRAIFRDEQLRAQAAVARLRAQQVDRWILQHTMDAQALAQAIRALPLNPLAAEGEGRQILGVLLGEVLAGTTDRTGVSVLAPDGKVLVGLGEDATPDAETLKAVTSLKTSVARFQIIDVHEVGGPKPLLRMAFVVPVEPGDGTGPPKMVVLVLTVDPTRELFRQVSTWPTDSPGSEVVLVRRDGDDLIYLTAPSLLDNKQTAPLSHRLPMTRTGLPEAQAILHGDAVREGLDYRGVHVFSASHHVAGVPWFVVAKTDVAALMAPIWNKTLSLALAVLAIILVTVFMVLLLWRGQRASYLSFRDLQIEERAAASKHFEELIHRARGQPVTRGGRDL
ncbi:MAG: hypothetical protein PS018_16170 [bacterium]|nr:hypothetical protein [bacterium]